MFPGGLYLHPPVQDSPAYENDKLIDTLKTVGLIADPSPMPGQPAWLAGDRFPELITFMGCSPHIVMEISEGAKQHPNLIYIRPGHEKSPTLITGENTRIPPCPSCRQTLDLQNRHLYCPHCHASPAPEALNWRKTAGVVRQFIHIHGIYPFEGIPSDELLSTLQEATARPWKHFYILP